MISSRLWNAQAAMEQPLPVVPVAQRHNQVAADAAVSLVLVQVIRVQVVLVET